MKIESNNTAGYVTENAQCSFTSPKADLRERAKMSFFEEVIHLFTNWKTYNSDGSPKSLSRIWNGSTDVGSDLDVSSIALANRV